MKKPTPIKIRKLNPRDFVEVLWIENVSFGDPWKKEDFQQCIRLGYLLMVATRKGKVVGYVVIRLLENQIELVNLAVEATQRRSGVGKKLLSWVQQQSQMFNKCAVSFMVRETNLNAQLFFRAMKIRAVKVIRSPFQGVEEDGFLFIWNLPHKRKFWPVNRMSCLFPKQPVK